MPSAPTPRSGFVVVEHDLRSFLRTLLDPFSGTEIESDRLQRHLERHGIRTEVCELDPLRMTVGQTISRWCEDNKPDLLVMGAYDHSKFRANPVGGVTSDLLRKIPAPILMAH